MDSTTESVEQKSAVLSALAKENEQFSEYRKQKNLSEVRVRAQGSGVQRQGSRVRGQG